MQNLEVTYRPTEFKTLWVFPVIMVKGMYLAIRNFNIFLLNPFATHAIPWPLKPFKLIELFAHFPTLGKQFALRFMGDVNRQRRLEIFFLFLNSDMVLRNSIPGALAYI